MNSDVFIPYSASELYEKMTSDQFTGKISVENDNLIWMLPNGITLKIIVDNQPQEGYIAVYYKDDKRKAQLTHWHPMEDEIYRDLYDINTGQIFWVKKKRCFFKEHPLFMDKSEWERYSEKRKSKYVVL